MKHPQSKLATLLLVIALSTVRLQAAIISISKPVNSDNRVTRATTAGVWSVSTPPYPLNTNLGIGYIINTSVSFSPDDFTMHDLVAVAPNTPDPARATVVYTFDEPIVVSSLKVIEHANGATKIEGFVGDSLNEMTSIGSVFGDLGDITGSVALEEGGTNIFTFPNSRPGLYFRFVVRKSSHPDGVALYRAFPRDATGKDIPPGPDFFITIQLSEIEVCWRSKSNLVYQVEYQSAVPGGDWMSLGAPVQGNGSTNCITDNIRGQPKKFYRVLPLP